MKKTPFYLPLTTYRIQFNHTFRFADAEGIIPYLHALGITDVYASPIFKSVKGSLHGYDVTDPTQINPEIGTEEEFKRFIVVLKQYGMGLLLDIVPNHMGIAGGENGWWEDVLTYGRSSRYAKFFDIDWDPPDRRLRNKILLPVLEGPFEKLFEKGKIRCLEKEGAVFIQYRDRSFPVSPKSAALLQKRESLRALLDAQSYCLSDWRLASSEINYRRFFDIASLVGVRVEEPEVFEAVHHFLFRLIREGFVQGLRIDHPDGLLDPEGYLTALQRRCREISEERPCYLLVEKILIGEEKLRRDWPVHGTTGYAILNRLNALFVDPAGKESFEKGYRAFTGESAFFGEILYESKKRFLDTAMRAEVRRLVRELRPLLSKKRALGKLSEEKVRSLLVELIASFPVYRSYLRPAVRSIHPEDRKILLSAGSAVKCKNPRIPPSLVDAVISIFLERPQGSEDFVLRFQQLTVPAMAKGFEDTALYRYYPLASLNEVGGDPERFGLPVSDFHRDQAERKRHWPYALLSLSTHDTKRSEDVRARMNVLSEIPKEWFRAVNRWRQLNRGQKTDRGKKEIPDAREEYLLYQTLIGTWPLEPMDEAGRAEFMARMEQYMEKVLREAKINTDWIKPDRFYEEAVRSFIRKILAPGRKNRFLSEFVPFQKKIAYAGMLNSLSQCLLQMTSVGLPDIYQGTGLWDLSLVDPDNRRPVDFQKRALLLEKLARQETDCPEKLIKDLLSHWEDGRIKLFLTYKTLNFRKQNRELFLNGAYLPLRLKGPLEDHAICFARRRGKRWCIVTAPRFFMKLGERRVFRNHFLLLPPEAPEKWRCLFTNKLVRAGSTGKEKRIPIGPILTHFPATVMEEVENS